MYSQNVFAAILMPWYIAMAVMVRGCAIATIVVVFLVQNAQTRRLTLLCSVVDMGFDGTAARLQDEG
jgi:low affinity Fe/Cu permease